MSTEEQNKQLIENLQIFLKTFADKISSDKEDGTENPVSKMEKQSRALCEDLNSRSFEKDAWIEKIKNFASNPTNRLIYSVISHFIFELDQDDHLLSNIKEVVKETLSAPEGEYDLTTKKMIVKLYDHINLAIRQKSLFKQDEQELRDRIKNIVKPEIEEKSSTLTKEITTQLVSLIAIFTALSFIVFGGISSLDSIFQSLQCVMVKKNTVLPTLIVAVAWAFCLMNLLFGFMYFVLRIAKSPTKEETKNIVQRYPAVFLCDMVLLFLLILFGGMWFAELHGIGRPVFDFVVKHNVFFFWIPIVILTILFGFLGRRLYAAYFGIKCFKRKKCNDNNDISKP